MNDQKKTMARINRADDWGAPPKPAPIDPLERPLPVPVLPIHNSPVPIGGIDLARPPGFVGQLAAWFETQNVRKREHAAVAGALVAIGNIAGLKYTDDSPKPASTNVFAFCVAGSRTGKDEVLGGVSMVHRTAGYAPCSYGRPKSEQEIIRNLVRHQPCLFVVDEIGQELTKIKNAKKRGGAAYLETIIALMMSAYSKANAYLDLTGDAKVEAAKELAKELSKVDSKLDGATTQKPALEKRKADLTTALHHIENGIFRPFVSLIGFGTPGNFNVLVDREAANDGFFGRAMIFDEPDDAPRTKVDFSKPPMPPEIESMIRSIATAGQAETEMMPGARIEYFGDKVVIPTAPDARAALNKISVFCDDQAIFHVECTGMPALWLGAFELVLKVSLILAIPDGERTLEHVAWAFKLVWTDVERKLLLALSNDGGGDGDSNEIQTATAKVKLKIAQHSGKTEDQIARRCRMETGDKRKTFDTIVADLIRHGLAKRSDPEKGANNKTARRLFDIPAVK